MSTITLVWGDNKANFELPALGDIALSSHDIAEAFQWSHDNRIHLTIVALKGPEGEILFSQESSSSTQLEDWDKKLTIGGSYELVLLDTREASVSQLSESQVAEIKKGFLEYDKDNSGEISIEEAEKAFQKKIDDYFKRIDNLQRIALNKATTDAEKETAIAKYTAMKERERAFNMKRLTDLKSRDTNGDNMISWEEYLTSEAPVILARDATRAR